LLIWRYFLKKHIAFIAIIAVMLVVMMVLVVLSIMSGLVERVRLQNHHWSGDIIISRDSMVGFPFYDEFIAQLDKNNIIEAATPTIKTFGLVNSRNPVQLLGIRIRDFCQVTNFADTLQHQPSGTIPDFTVADLTYVKDSDRRLTDRQRKHGCIPGIYTLSRDNFSRNTLWYDGKLLTYLPFDITVFGINSKGVLTGSETGEYRKFWYVDDSDSGLIDVDSSTIYVDFNQLQKLCWMNGTDGKPKRAGEIRIKLSRHITLAQGYLQIKKLWMKFIDEIKMSGQDELLGDVKIETWKQYRRSHIGPMEREKSLMIVIFCLIGLVAVFIVFAIFYMIVTEKIKDLGIVKSVGGTGWGVSQIFLGYGLLVGLAGALMGIILGSSIVLHSNDIDAWLNKHFGFQLWPPDIYAIDKIPDVVDYRQAFVIALVAILASVAGAFLPARRAARLGIVETLQVD